MVIETRSASNKRRKLTSSPGASAERVLALPELLAQILLNVDQQTLLVSGQRTCRKWQEVIHSTAGLRRHLFLDVPCDSSSHQERAFNPLLTRPFRSFFEFVADEEPTSEDYLLQDKQRWYRGHLIARTELCRIMKVGEGEQKPTWADYGSERHRQIEAANPFLHNSASWLNMHVTDPATTRVGIFDSHTVWHSSKQILCMADVAGGLRMKDLYRATMYGRIGGIQVLWPQSRRGTFCGEEGKFGGDANGAWRRQVRLKNIELMIYCSSSSGCSMGSRIRSTDALRITRQLFFEKYERKEEAGGTFIADAIQKRRREATKSESNPLEYFDTDYESDPEETEQDE